MAVLATAILFACALIGHAHAAATLLPPGENCFQATTGINGMVGTLGTITGGTGGTNGTYSGVALTGGSGSGATANITVSGGAVTAIAILSPGTQYVVGDTLSAASGSIGNVTGFSVPVASVAINSSLAGGSVYFYIPNTTTFKQTWSNATQTVLNPNPVILDQNGCAVIYGTGTYRQVLKDQLGNTVWDQTTTDTSATNSTFWAGLAGGTPNVITVVDPGFNATDGSIVNFTALATNTSAATLNPSSFGAIPILKDTTAGPVALTGGEIVQSNPISAIFRATDNAFHLLNTVIASASGTTAPLCGATNLTIGNNGANPNSILSILADQVVMQTTAGITVNRSNVTLGLINITTGNSVATANGMDGEAPGTSGWLYIWAIDNGGGAAGLVSTASGNGLNPTLPSGYTYKCRLGAMRVDGSGNLLRTLQHGNVAQYQVTGGGTLPLITNAFGTYWTGQPISSFVPPTAAAINTAFRAVLSANFGGTATEAAAVAPNGGYGAAPSSAPCAQSLNNGASGAIATDNTMICSFVLESTNLFTGNTSASAATLSALGWRDAVNAN
ncbi:MAG TPA: hypothetical protein VKX28_26825 [Xanthobacteraceae bacterium]|nr:hypothetical protein [Xanthobacteraceae bacterium]